MLDLLANATTMSDAELSQKKAKLEKKHNVSTRKYME